MLSSITLPSFIKMIRELGNGFFVVICDIKNRNSKFFVNLENIMDHIFSKIIILMGKIFIYKQNFWVADNSTSRCDTLTFRIEIERIFS